MLKNKNEKEEQLTSKLELEKEQRNMNHQPKDTQKQIDLESSIINNIDNNLNEYNIKNKNLNINQNESNIFILNENIHHSGFKGDFLITGLPEIKKQSDNEQNTPNNNNNDNNNAGQHKIKEEPKNKIDIQYDNSNIDVIKEKYSIKSLNKVKSATNLTSDNNRNIRFNILKNSFPKLKKIKINLNPEHKTEREIEEEKRKILIELRNKELLIDKEHQLNVNNLINNIYKKNSNNYSSLKKIKKGYKYLYMSGEEKEKQRQKEEDFLISLENEKRKMKLSPISSDELNKFSQEVLNNQKMLKADLEIKKLQLYSLWKERKKLLPNYKSKFQEMNQKYDNDIKNLEINKQEQIRKEVKNKKSFGEIIYRNFQPKIVSDKLKNEREQKIKKLNGVGRYNDIKNLGKKLKLMSKKIYDSQPKNFRTNNKLIIEDNINRKIPLLRPIDYLAQSRIMNEKNALSSRRNMSCDKINNIENKLTIQGDDYNNIMDIKIEAKMLQNKAKEKRLLLKYEKESGNVDKVDKLNSEISQLYYNSIKAKLKILSKLNNGQE